MLKTVTEAPHNNFNIINGLRDIFSSHLPAGNDYSQPKFLRPVRLATAARSTRYRRFAKLQIPDIDPQV